MVLKMQEGIYFSFLNSAHVYMFSRLKKRQTKTLFYFDHLYFEHKRILPLSKSDIQRRTAFWVIINSFAMEKLRSNFCSLTLNTYVFNILVVLPLIYLGPVQVRCYLSEISRSRLRLGDHMHFFSF